MPCSRQIASKSTSTGGWLNRPVNTCLAVIGQNLLGHTVGPQSARMRADHHGCRGRRHHPSVLGKAHGCASNWNYAVACRHCGWQWGHHIVVLPALRPCVSRVPQRGQIGSGSSRTPVSHRRGPGTRPCRTAVRNTRRIVACNLRRSSASRPATDCAGCSRACQQISSVSRLPSPAMTAWSSSVAFSRPRRPIVRAGLREGGYGLGRPAPS